MIEFFRWSPNCFRIPCPLVVFWCHYRKEEALLSPDDDDDEDDDNGDDDDDDHGEEEGLPKAGQDC